MNYHEDYEKLMLVSQGHVAFQLLKSGMDLGLFDLLDQHGPLSLGEIQEHLKLEANPCKILVRGLYSLDLINKEGERFCNKPIAKDFLVSNGPIDLKSISGWQEKIVYPAITDLTSALVENKNIGLRHFSGSENNLYERLSHNDDLKVTFQKSMTALSNGANQAFYDALDLTDSNLIVDVGGGEGTNLHKLLQAHPDKKGIVFDLAPVCKMAEDNFKNWGCDKQITTHPGDLLKDPLPKGADTFLFCHMFTIWSDDIIVKILNKCYDALEEGGRVVVFNMFSNDDEHGPVACALGSPYFLTIANGHGKLHTWQEYNGWFKQTGFKDVEYHPGLPMDHGFIVATK